MTEKKDAITMLHGAGGTVMHDLVKNYVVKYMGSVFRIQMVKGPATLLLMKT